MDENKMTQTGERLLTVDNLKTTFMIHKTKVEAVRGASTMWMTEISLLW